jgi:putative transposase
MLSILGLLFSFLGDSLRSRVALQAEILALRHQLLVLERSQHGRRPRLQNADRIFWVWLSRLWQGWRSAVRIVKADTVIAWSRRGSVCIGAGRAGNAKADLVLLTTSAILSER